MNKFKNLRGTIDLLPDQLIKWQNVEKIIIQQLFRSSVKEIRTPILEMTELFMRGIGEGTDVVSKEMYTFLDRGERSCTCLLYTSPSPRDKRQSRMPSSA